MEKLQWLDKKERELSKNLSDLTSDKIVKYLKKKKTAPKGRLRDFYGGKSNADLTRLIFKVFLETAIKYVINGGIFEFPLPTQPHLYVGTLSDAAAMHARQRGNYRHIDMRKTGYKIYCTRFNFGPNSNRREMEVILTKRLYRQLVKNQNSGMTFPKMPRMRDVKKDRRNT